MSAIKVVDYDPAWPALFEAQKRTILSIVGDMVEDIHHVGSTAVEGLCAKPKIDIDTVLRGHELIPEAIERIKPHGYAFQGEPYNDGDVGLHPGPRLIRRAALSSAGQATPRTASACIFAIICVPIPTLPPPTAR